MRTYKCIVSHIVCNRVSGDRYLDYTPLPAAAFVPNGAAIERQNIADTFATPDPQAEIAALRAERDALKAELSVANDAAMEGDLFKFAVRDIVRDINRTITDDFYEAVDQIEALLGEPGA